MRRIACPLLATLLLPLASIAEERGLFVAVGYGGRRMSSSDGLTWAHDQRWSDIAADDDHVLFNVAFGAGKFVAVGGGARLGRIVTTGDGRTWHEFPPLAGRVATVAFGHGRFIAAHDAELLASRDGETFTPGARLDWRGSIHARRSACGDTEAGYRTVIIGDLDLPGEKRRVSWRGVTSDGTRWEHSALETPPARDIAHGSGHFVVVGPDGLIESSHDGETWTRREAPGAGDFTRVVWTGERFVTSGGKAMWTSPDGLTWRAEAAAIPCSLAWMREGALAIGFSWGGNLHTSRDLRSWQKQPLPAGPSLLAVAFGRPKIADR